MSSFLASRLLLHQNTLIPSSLLWHFTTSRITVASFVEVSKTQIRQYAARKGTRERKQKKKVKVVIEKVGFIPHNLRNKDQLLQARPKLRHEDLATALPVDDVYVDLYYRKKLYSVCEAVQCHKETHHPDICNKPDADLHVSIELNMRAEKKTRFMDDIRRIVAVPHTFEHGEDRSVIAFSKTDEDHAAAKNAGASLSGGVDLIKQIQNGLVSLQDFQFVVAHPNILPELVQLRGLMKRKFPNPTSGTLDVDVAGMVERYMYGINYLAKKDEYEKDFGLLQTVIGTLNMDAKALEGNFAALIRDVYAMRPKREGEFITSCFLWSPPSAEKFKIEYESYLNIVNKEEEEEDVGEVVAL